MSRRSIEDKMTNVVAIVPNKRAEPPDELTPEQQKEWDKITEQKPHDWWGASLPILECLCRHICLARLIARELQATNHKRETDRFRRWQKMAVAESKMISSLSTKLRLTPQSKYSKQMAAAKKYKVVPDPWEIGRDDDDAG